MTEITPNKDKRMTFRGRLVDDSGYPCVIWIGNTKYYLYSSGTLAPIGIIGYFYW